MSWRLREVLRLGLIGSWPVVVLNVLQRTLLDRERHTRLAINDPSMPEQCAAAPLLATAAALVSFLTPTLPPLATPYRRLGLELPNVRDIQLFLPGTGGLGGSTARLHQGTHTNYRSSLVCLEIANPSGYHTYRQPRPYIPFYQFDSLSLLGVVVGVPLSASPSLNVYGEITPFFSLFPSQSVHTKQRLCALFVSAPQCNTPVLE